MASQPGTNNNDLYASSHEEEDCTTLSLEDVINQFETDSSTKGFELSEQDIEFILTAREREKQQMCN